ncbi:MAG TPA: PAS domain S-box protein [Terriglobales bacterium]
MPEPQGPPGSPRPQHQLEKEEARLWRIALLFLVFLATALAVVTWERLQSLPYYLGVLPLLLLLAVIAFAGFSYGRKRQVSGMKDLVRDLQDRAVPSEEQLDQFTQMIARSQRSFKDLIDAFDDLAFAFSLDGSVRTVNRRVTQLLGVPYQAVVGHKLDDFIEEPARAQVEAALARFIESRHWSGLITVRLKGNPRTLYFDCDLNAIVNNEEVVGVSALARDVTEEREKETRFTELFETLQEGVYFSTPEGKLLDANDSLVRMLGYANKEELLALDPLALSFDAGRGPILGRRPDDEGNVRTREVTVRRKDGGSLLVLDASRAVRDEAGKIIRYQGTLVDVTERREMEKELQRQEEFQRYLLESFPELILVVDLEGRFSFVSSRIRDLLGYKPEELRGKRVEDMPENSSPLVALYRDVSGGRRLFGFCEYEAQHRDGTGRTMRASASPLFDSASKVNGVIVSVRDITVEKKLEQQIIQSERLAAMGHMIGGFAHELNNPLTSILGAAELLQEGETTEASRKQLTMLQQQARRATEIVQNLMYFSRPPAAGKSPVNVPELIQRTLHLHAYSLRKNNVTVDFLSDTSVPSVNGDPHQLMQVFLNLVMNAEQAIREIRERGTLRIRLDQADNSVLVVFQDDGPGIPPEILSKIFDPFYTTKRPGRGTGLGLSICKAIRREHGGNVEVASGPGGGAAFTVTLPIAVAAPSAQGM